MVRRVISCGPDTLVEEAGRVMRERRVGCLPVVQADRLIGIVTDDDILDFLLAITGCKLSDTTRIAVHLPDRTGELGRLLGAINAQGGYIATVVSPTALDETGMRIAIVRYRADDPPALDRYLRDQGYDLITEVLPEAPGGGHERQ
jgi:acetoin utilization protein AcuB